MNKLFSIGFRRTLKFLNTEEITTRNVDAIMKDHNVRKVGAFIYYRMPRTETKQFIKVPCPIQNFDSPQSQELISSSKSIRASFSVDEKKICGRCPFKDQCLKAQIMGEENNLNAIKDLLLFSQAMHNHVNPQQIQYKVWKSGYKIMDTVLAVIQDLSQNAKDSLQFEAIRVRHLENKEMEMEEQIQPIEHKKTKKKHQNRPLEQKGLKNANKAMKDINPPSHHPQLERKLKKSSFRQQASFSMEEKKRSKPQKQKKYSEEYFSINQSEPEDYESYDHRRINRQNLKREHNRFPKENINNRFQRDQSDNRFSKEKKNHKFQKQSNQFSRENQKFEKERNKFEKTNYSQNMYQRSNSQRQYSQRERDHYSQKERSRHFERERRPSHQAQHKEKHSHRDNEFSEYKNYKPRTENRNAQYQSHKYKKQQHRNVEEKNYKPRTQGNEFPEYRKPKKFLESWEKMQENQMLEKSMKMGRREEEQQPRRGRRIMRK